MIKIHAITKEESAALDSAEKEEITLHLVGFLFLNMHRLQESEIKKCFKSLYILGVKKIQLPENNKNLKIYSDGKTKII